MRQVIRELRYLLPRRDQRLTVVMLCLLACGAVLETVNIAAIPLFVTLLGAPRRLFAYLPEPAARAIPRGVTDSALIFSAAAALLGFTLVKNAALVCLSTTQSRFMTGRQTALSARVLRAYLYAPYRFHLRRNTADLLRNASQESHEIFGNVVGPLLTMALDGFTIVAIMAVLLVREPLVSLIALGLLGGTTAAFVTTVRRRLIHFGEEMQIRRAGMIRVVTEGLASVKITKVLAREEHFADAYLREVQSFGVAARVRGIASDLPRLFLETAAIAGLLSVASLLLLQGRPTQAIVPVLSLFAVAVVRMIPSFNRITGALTGLRYGRHSLRAVYVDLRALESLAPEAPSGETAAMPFDREILLDNVSFRYEAAARPSLEHVTLRIAKGSAVGVVGSTGSGKTTLMDIVLGLLEPTEGRVLVDGRDARTDLRAWRRRVGYVPQDVYLTDDTIRRNIALGLADREIDQAAVDRAVEAAQLVDFVASLPERLDTMVGERGVRISGGQRQRIGIARALYANPDVLVMDEATSSLDGETERCVMGAVDRLRGDRTIILVAHRMSTVRNCDNLVLLSDGAVSATGTYDELFEGNQRFRRLAAAATGV